MKERKTETTIRGVNDVTRQPSSRLCMVGDYLRVAAACCVVCCIIAFAAVFEKAKEIVRGRVT